MMRVGDILMRRMIPEPPSVSLCVSESNGVFMLWDWLGSRGDWKPPDDMPLAEPFFDMNADSWYWRMEVITEAVKNV